MENEENQLQEKNQKKARKETRIKLKCFEIRVVKENCHLKNLYTFLQTVLSSEISLTEGYHTSTSRKESNYCSHISNLKLTL